MRTAFMRSATEEVSRQRSRAVEGGGYEFRMNEALCSCLSSRWRHFDRHASVSFIAGERNWQSISCCLAIHSVSADELCSSDLIKSELSGSAVSL